LASSLNTIGDGIKNTSTDKLNGLPSVSWERKHYPPEEDLVPKFYTEDPMGALDCRWAYSEFFYAA